MRHPPTPNATPATDAGAAQLPRRRPPQNAPRRAAYRGDDVGRLVEDGHRRGAEARSPGLEVVKIHQGRVAVVLGEHRHRRAAGDDAEQVVPAADHALRARWPRTCSAPLSGAMREV
eukprot:6393949-Prymnesium_polylepis.1